MSALDTVFRRAGAVMVDRDGSTVAAHYGSPAGELAVCVRAVGIADRSDLGKLVVTGRPDMVDEFVQRCAGASLAASGVAISAGAWWCAAAPDRVIVLCDPLRRAQLLEVARMAARQHPGVQIDDRSRSLAAIAVAGRSLTGVLSALAALGPADDPRSAPPFGPVGIAGAEAFLLLQSDHRALFVTEAADADLVWHAVEQAGRPFGMGYVGTEALERFALLERSVAGMPR
jgi:glycine cleavage system aminomethyltransferase T